MAEIENLKIGANGTIHIVGNENIITEEWEASKTYVKDKSYVIREHKLYVCNVTHTSTSSFDPTKWTEITVIGAIDNALDMTDTASGAIATFESEYALPLRNLEIEINAVQSGSGTPSPDNVRPITGFTGANIKVVGKNLVDFLSDLKSSSNGLSISIDNGGIKFVNQPTASWADLSNTINVFLPKGTYTFSRTTSATYNVYIDVIFEDNTTATMSITSGTTSRTATYTKNIIGVKLHLSSLSTSTTYSETIYLQFEEGSTATTYTEFNANSTTTPITWQSEAGTVYGGSLDVTSGVLTINRKYITLDGTQTVNVSPAYIKSDACDGYITNADIYPNNVFVSYQPDLICDTFEQSKIQIWSQVGYPNKFAINNNQIHLNIANSDLGVTDYTQETTSSIQTKITEFLTNHPVHLLIPINPVTYQLTPTQISAIVGTNNVFTDTNGDTTLEYYTKRGEQTIRIAEGVAVDVINNKNIDNLTTTNKTLVGAVNEVVRDKANKSDVYTKTQIDSVSTATVPASIGSGKVYYKVFGNLVIVWGLINTISGIATGQAVITGLPRNMIGANNVIKAINNDGTSADWVLYQPNGNTSMLSSIAHTGSKSYTISFSYYTN